MARNTGKSARKGAIKERSQVINPKTGLYVKRDAASGKFMDVKKDGKPFKGITKEEIQKLSPALKKLADYDKKGKN
ncbi:MAG: hypothetical protein ABIO24_13725 [Saprospiraceae bacterium]